MFTQFLDKSNMSKRLMLESKKSLYGFCVDPERQGHSSQICDSAIFRAEPDREQKDTIKSLDPTRGNGWADR